MFQKVTLDILIPSLENRSESLHRLKEELTNQIEANNLTQVVNIRTNIDGGQKHIGVKRNELIRSSFADYVCFLDDDDWIDAQYVLSQYYGCTQGKDCVELRGIYTENGLNPKPFFHSIKYESYYSKDGNYFRPPNHLNAIKRELVLKIKFAEVSFGEDTDWALRVAHEKLLKTEAENTKFIYQYLYKTKGNFTKLRIQFERIKSKLIRTKNSTLDYLINARTSD